MIALISPAKKMVEHAHLNPANLSAPRFEEHTSYILSLMRQYDAAELAQIFGVSGTIARELRGRFLDFDSRPLAAIESYDGVVYKHLKGAEGLCAEQYLYLQQRVRISSLLYGLLRPLDAIRPYRMEGNIRLAGTDERVDHSWRAIQTQTLIDDVNAAGGTLIYLASKEEQSAFDWRRVKHEVRVIEIQFLQHKGDKLRQVVVYTKMARGEMLRFMAQNNHSDPEALKAFEWSGYSYRDDLSSENVWVWVMD